MLILITGGSGSGKSAYAETLLLGLPAEKRIYLATMDAPDEESRLRIERHKRMREGKGFLTWECQRDLQAEVEKKSGQLRGAAVLLEDLSNLAANELFGGEQMDVSACLERITAGLRALLACCSDLVIVTNEIFSDGAEYDEGTCSYLRLLGELNLRVARQASRVMEVVCGIPVRIR